MRDTGAGIPPDEIPRLFERFRRVAQRLVDAAGVALARLGGDLDDSRVPERGIDRVAHPRREPYGLRLLQAVGARTGIFKKVEVQVKPEAPGLHVMFVMEPAYYYGVTKFPGAEKAFTYTRLLQVVNLPDQDPFEEKNVQKAKTALVNFLQIHGYFQTQVDPSTDLDKAHGLANVTFHVKLGKRAKIGQVEVQGPPPEEARLGWVCFRPRSPAFAGKMPRVGRRWGHSPRRAFL